MAKSTVYAHLRDPKEGEKIAPQAQIICDVLKEKGPLTGAQLLEALEGRIETVQPVERVFGFYRKRLIDSKLISATNPPKAKRSKAKKKAEEAENVSDQAQAANNG